MKNHREVFQTIAESILRKRFMEKEPSKILDKILVHIDSLRRQSTRSVDIVDGRILNLIFDLYFLYYGFRKIMISWHTISISSVSLLKKKLGFRFHKIKTKNVSTYMIGGPKLSLRTFEHLGKMYQRVFGRAPKDAGKIHKKTGEALGYITPSGRKEMKGYQYKTLFFHFYSKKRVLLKGQLYGPQTLIFRKVQKKILLKKIQKKVDKMNKLLAKLDKAWEVRYEIK